MLRFQDNPPMTLPTAAGLDSRRHHWRVAYCKPRQEKALAWDLCRREIPYFLPLVLRETSSGGRRRRNLYPLFTSYLFFAGEEKHRQAVLRTNRLLSVLEISAAEQFAFRREIASLETALRSAPEKLRLHPKLIKGRPVKITSGPMAGAEGVVHKADPPAKLWVGVRLMGAGVLVEISADMVEPLGRSRQSSSRGHIEYDVGAGRFVATRRLMPSCR